MAFTDTAAVLSALKARIEALTPSNQASDDDVFRVTIGTEHAHVSGRSVILTATAGIRKRPSLACDEWQTTVDVLTYRADVPPEEGQATSHAAAITDAEAILADLYLWASGTDGIRKFDTTEAPVQPDDGDVNVTRTLRIEYQRG
jgi:hypothetical protein